MTLSGEGLVILGIIFIDDARRHGLRRRLARPLAPLRGHDLHGATTRALCEPHPRRSRRSSTGVAPEERGRRLAPLPQPGGLARRARPRRRRPGSACRSSSRASASGRTSTLVLLFLNLLPHSKHFHIITAIPNVFARDLAPAGPPRRSMAASAEKLGEMVMAAAEEPDKAAPVGVARIEHFTWKAILDFYTCTECGRCSDNCPAHKTGKILSPSTSRSTCATTSTGARTSSSTARAGPRARRRRHAHARGTSTRTARRTARRARDGTTSTSHDGRTARRSRAPRARRCPTTPSRSPRSCRSRSISSPTSSTPTCSGPARPAAPARSSARCSSLRRQDRRHAAQPRHGEGRVPARARQALPGAWRSTATRGTSRAWTAALGRGPRRAAR